MRTFKEFVGEMEVLGIRRGAVFAAYTYAVLAIAGFLAFCYMMKFAVVAAYEEIGLWMFLPIGLSVFFFGSLAWLIAEQEPHQ